MTNSSSHRSLTPEDLAHPHPVYVVWELTLRCDQACRHCGSRAGAPRADELDTAEALDVVEQLAAMGVREITLIGGESYLRPDWVDIARAITDRGIVCSVVSGGRHLSPERARRAKEAGIRSVSISFDGLEETHDGLRAVPGSWRSALAAVDAVREVGLVATVNSQINARNHTELEALGAVLFEHGIKAWQLQLTTPMGRAADQDHLVLQPWQILDVLPRLERLSEQARAAGCLLMASNNIGYFGPHEGALRAGGHWIGCTGGRWSLGLQSDGTVKACSSLPSEPYGARSVREAPIAEIWATDRALERVGSRSVDDLWGFCRDCYYAEVCMAGCVWTAHTFLGRPGNMPYCHHRALELRQQGLRERLVLEEPAPGRSFDHGTWRLVVEPWEDEQG